MRLWEQANPWGTVSVHLWWCWCLHRHWLRYLSSRHLWGYVLGKKDKKKKKRFTSAEKKAIVEGNWLCIVLQSRFYHPPGLFCSDFFSVMHAFQSHGLLVLADWTSRCCELEWHSVMDDLPHADLAKSLAHCCRVCLAVKTHTALGQDGLFLTKNTKIFSYCFHTATFKVVRVVRASVPVHTWYAAFQFKIFSPRWKLIFTNVWLPQ